MNCFVLWCIIHLKLRGESFEKLVGKEAKVAMLSYSTKGSAKSDLVDKVVKATEIKLSDI